MNPRPPAQWYPDPERAGQWRYWDGRAWTEHRAPIRASAPRPTPTAPPVQERKSNWFARHKVLSVLGVLLLLGFCTPEFTDDDESDTSAEEAGQGGGSWSDEPDAGEEAADEDKDKADAEPKRRAKRYAVLRVIDGDTVELDYKGGTTVRVIGIDTPETVSPSVPDECGGGAATNTARSLLEGKSVEIRFDPAQDRSDTYGRLLAYLTVPGIGDYGTAMLKRGRAAELTYDGAYRLQNRYQMVEARARQADRNMWGSCGGPGRPLDTPPKPKPVPEEPANNCGSGYDPCIPAYPPDLNCADVSGPITVTGSDPHGLDAEGDGIACE